MHSLASNELLNSVSDTITSSTGVGYGGVDEEGALDPSAKGRGELDPADVPDDQQVWEQGLW